MEQTEEIIKIEPESDYPSDLLSCPTTPKPLNEDLEDPLESEMQVSSAANENPKSSKSQILTTNTAKYAYAQTIVKEVMRRVPIFTQTEDEEKKFADKLRIRMMRIKNRILKDIKIPLEEQEEVKKNAKDKRYQKYKKMVEKETPEEAAERRKREAEAKSYQRNIKKELETPEMLIERRIERLKKRLERKANETPEERAARREQTRNYRQMLKDRRTEKTVVIPKTMICAKTGKIYEKTSKRPRKKRTDIIQSDNAQEIKVQHSYNDNIK